MLDEPLDAAFGIPGGELDGISVTQTGAGIQGVADVGFDTVLFIENGSDASLGIVGGPLTQGSLAQYHHPSVVSKTQCEGEAGGTTANDKNITTVFNVLFHKYH